MHYAGPTVWDNILLRLAVHVKHKLSPNPAQDALNSKLNHLKLQG